jgi:hypothetical protein
MSTLHRTTRKKKGKPRDHHAHCSARRHISNTSISRFYKRKHVHFAFLEKCHNLRSFCVTEPNQAGQKTPTPNTPAFLSLPPSHSLSSSSRFSFSALLSLRNPVSRGETLCLPAQMMGTGPSRTGNSFLFPDREVSGLSTDLREDIMRGERGESSSQPERRCRRITKMQTRMGTGGERSGREGR